MIKFYYDSTLYGILNIKIRVFVKKKHGNSPEANLSYEPIHISGRLTE